MAGGKSAILTIKILTDASQSAKGIDEASGRLGKFQSGVSKVTPYAVAAGAALVAFGKSAVDSASRTQQAMGAVDSVFGKQAGTIKSWAADSASSVGLASSEYMEFASTIGAQLQNMGLSAKDATAGTGDLISLGADLAATFGGTTADAVGALSAALRGEADPAERYGLALNQTAVKAELAKKGLDKLTGEAATTAKAQTILEMATKQAGGAVGQFARESDTAAGSAQIASAKWEDAKSALGEALLPAVTAVTTALASMAGWMSQNSTAVTIALGVVGGLVAVILTLNAALKVYNTFQALGAALTARKTAAQVTNTAATVAGTSAEVAASSATKGLTVAQRALNAVMRANPVGIVITAIMLLIGGIVLLWNKNKGFRDFVKGAWKAISTAAIAAWNAIKRVVMAVLTWMSAKIRSVRAVISAVWSAIRSSASAAWNGIKSVVASVAAWMAARIRSLRATINAVWSAIRSAASSAWNGVRSIVSGVVASIKRIIQGVKSIANSVFNGIKNVARSAFNAILAPIRAVKSAIDSIANAVRSAIGWLGKLRFPSPPKWLSKIVGRSAPAAVAPSAAAYGAAAGPSLLRSGPSLAGALAAVPGQLSGGLGGLVVINVSGTLNDVDAARAVRRVLRNDSRRRGGVVIDRRRSEAVTY